MSICRVAESLVQRAGHLSGVRVRTREAHPRCVTEFAPISYNASRKLRIAISGSARDDGSSQREQRACLPHEHENPDGVACAAPRWRY